MSDPVLQRVGTTIRNKWTLERLLGMGGMAAVYVGIHRIGRRDALKILHPKAAKSKDICNRFEREAHAANKFQHPGAVEIRDIDVTEDGAPFLVMELLQGETLTDLERRVGTIALEDLLHYTEQVLDTLDAAHAQGIIHRDIKPTNLYVIQNKRIKILDFGLARVHQDQAIQGELTRMGLVLGTTQYMPPEQAKGRQIDVRADVFAVGATMFRLISGRHVHSGTEFELLLKMANDPAPQLAKVAPGTPNDVCLVVDRALAFDREQRYPDVKTMLADVRALMKGEHPPYALARGIDAMPVTVSADDVATPRPDPIPEVLTVAQAAPSTTTIPVVLSESFSKVDDSSMPGDSMTADFSEGSQVSDASEAASSSIAVEWSEEPSLGGTAVEWDESSSITSSVIALDNEDMIVSEATKISGEVDPKEKKTANR